MQWSHYSLALFDLYLKGTENIIVQACPGAGKTTNIKHMWSLDSKSTLYVVFNKHNQLEAQQKLPVKTASSVLTLNGLGHRILMNNYGNVTLDDQKVRKIVNTYVPINERERWSVKKVKIEKRQTLLQAVVKAKSVADQLSQVQYADMLSTYDLDDYEGMLTDVNFCLQMNDRDTAVIDYDDQIRLPALYQLNMPTFQVVLGDEVQDFSPMQAQLLHKLYADRYVLVGDCHQSMYGFKGAMSNSMDVLKEQFSCVQLPLSITYRCGSEIVTEAAKLYGDIEPYCNIHRGIVRYDSSAVSAGVSKDTLVLCRMNKPLIDLAYSLLERGIACHVRGRDIGQGLIRLIKRMEADTVSILLDKLEFWYGTEMYKATARQDDAKIKSLDDKYSSLQLFCSKHSLHDSVQCVIASIDAVFTDGKGVCLSTIHKAKGLEARRAIIVDSYLHNHFMNNAKRSWQREQEKNILYVAVTRAIQELIYV